MLIKTHLSIGIFAVLFFLNHVTHKTAFIVILLAATLLPSIDSGFSTLGFGRFKPLSSSVKNRGFFHSFTFCILASVFLAFYFPIVAFPFFLGYGLHLFLDAWTVEGIRPFWPSKKIAKGNLKAGGITEESLFLIFCILDFLFFVLLFI